MATVQEICKMANANVASINYYFTSKRKLYDEVWRYIFSQAENKYPLDLHGSEIKPEAKLFRFFHTMLLRVFDEDKAGYFPKIMIREMVEPTKSLDDIVIEIIKPMSNKIDSIIYEFLGNNAPETTVALCKMSIVSQYVLMGINKPIRERLGSANAIDKSQLEIMARHMSDFTIAGIKNIKKHLKRK